MLDSKKHMAAGKLPSSNLEGLPGGGGGGEVASSLNHQGSKLTLTNSQNVSHLIICRLQEYQLANVFAS